MLGLGFRRGARAIGIWRPLGDGEARVGVGGIDVRDGVVVEDDSPEKLVEDHAAEDLHPHGDRRLSLSGIFIFFIPVRSFNDAGSGK